MLVYILNKHGKPLMPCKPRKARLLLKNGKAKVIKRTPFTIQLLYGSSGYKQPVTLGVDSGYNTIGLSAVTEKQEVFSAKVELRKDLVKLNSERRQYRRARRSRKTRYRKPRFLNRNKPEGWLAPSMQHKLDSHIEVINRVKKILPISRIIVEVASFDIQRIKNPDIQGIEYQNGEQKGSWNTREYVLHRDGHICQNCFGKSRVKVLQVHHIESRQTGGDRPENIITLCSTCHDKVTKKEIKLKVPLSKGFKAETFMTMVRWKLVNYLRSNGDNVAHTYGYITKQIRIEQGVPKSHINDAFVISGGKAHQRMHGYIIQQVRKSNRKLYKGDRSHIRNTAARFVKAFQRFDKVLFEDIECFIFARRTSGYFDLRRLDGTKVNPSASYKQLRLLERANRFLVVRKEDSASSPA